MNIGIPELLVILVIVALLFGTTKLRNIGSDLGSAIKGFRNALRDDKDSGADAGANKPAETRGSAGEDAKHRDKS